MDMMGMGEKKNEKYIHEKTRKKFPVWLPSPYSFLEDFQFISILSY